MRVRSNNYCLSDKPSMARVQAGTYVAPQADHHGRCLAWNRLANVDDAAADACSPPTSVRAGSFAHISPREDLPGTTMNWVVSGPACVAALHPARPRFRVGAIHIAPDALLACQRAHASVADLLARHVQGDWGDLCADDWRQNDLSIGTGLRILSVYRLADDAQIAIVTEWDRSETAVLLLCSC